MKEAYPTPCNYADFLIDELRYLENERKRLGKVSMQKNSVRTSTFYYCVTNNISN